MQLPVLENEMGKQAIFLLLDLSDIPAVRKLAQEFVSYVPFRFSLRET